MAVVFSIVDSDLASKKHSFVVDDVDDDVDGRNVMSVFFCSATTRLMFINSDTPYRCFHPNNKRSFVS